MNLGIPTITTCIENLLCNTELADLFQSRFLNVAYCDAGSHGVGDLRRKHTDATLSDNKDLFSDARINTPAAMHRDTRDAEEGGFAWINVL